MNNFDPNISVGTIQDEFELPSIVYDKNVSLEVRSSVIRTHIEKLSGIKLYPPCNVYSSAKLGKGVQVAQFAEVGHNVIIGDNVKIGKGAFLCEGVTLEDDVFIAPHVCFSNDMYPPSEKSQWLKTTIKKGARIGAGAIIRPGVTIGEDSIVGVGGVVTKDIPEGEIWAGNPAKKLRSLSDIERGRGE